MSIGELFNIGWMVYKKEEKHNEKTNNRLRDMKHTDCVHTKPNKKTGMNSGGTEGLEVPLL